MGTLWQSIRGTTATAITIVMDKEYDHDRGGTQCNDLESRPWSKRPPQRSATNSRTNQAEQTYINDEQHVPSPLLSTRLTMSMCRSLDSKSRSFLPSNQIDTITPPLVKEELNRAMPTLPESVLHNYTAQILGITIDDVAGQEKDSRESSLELQVPEARLLKTFITLVLIGKVETIPLFIVCGFTDSLLPIGHAHFQNEKASRYHHSSLVLLVTRCFDKWKMSSIDAFIKTQWVVLSPFLSAPTADVSLYDFSAQTILPIFDDDAAATSSIKIGGYSTVRKVKIHHRHRDFGDNRDNTYFALKKLRSQQIEDFQREVAALRPFVISPHPHVVKLLAAFRHESSFYLLFPWAEGGSLYSFWKDNPNPILDASLSRWVSEQCLGIVTALCQIHHGHSTLKAGSSHYGRHGDIKPANILLFQKNIRSKNLVWTLGDFGLGILNRQMERNRGDHPIGFSPTYRAPELDIKGTIDSAYDVWSLGCVLLEILTWMLCGWEGVKSFALSRVDVDQRTDKARDRDDGFFRIVSRQGGPPDAQLKTNVVLWVNNLIAAKAASPYITDLVNLTRNDLLDTDRETRASISRVVEKLQCLRQRCLEDPTYTVAIPRPRKPPWPTRKLTSLHQNNSSVLKSKTQPTIFKMDQLPSQGNFWTNFGESCGGDDDVALFNFSPNDMMPTEGVSGGRQFGVLPHRHILPKEQTSPTQSILGDLKSRRRVSDDMTGHDNMSHEPKKKKVRKKGGTLTQNISKDKPPDILEHNLFQASGYEVVERSGPDVEGKLFACPFYKRNPGKYNTKAWKACTIPEGRTINRLKEHIYRNHCSARHRCDRCLDEFENMYDLQQHRRSETPCLIRDSHNCIDTIDETQKGEIRRKQRGISEEEKWKKIYRIIFKLDPTSEVPSPYCDAIEKESGIGDDQDGTDTLAKFEAFLHHLADNDRRNASEINGCLDLVKRFRREHAQDKPVENVLSEMPPLTCDYSDTTAWTSESQGFPSSTLTTIDDDDDTHSTDFSTVGTDQLPAPPFLDDSFAAHFNKVFSSDKPYSFPDIVDLRDDGGTLPGG
ncbi:kinase-like domain-containing protein [Daldinia decipiens]|uniref:kinase-like domain-containing protein n=1 Tax=Daldinia decipiens TaxID=326647 RepID=UPI0020C2A067|nr:kinase-like domain-containing protein [Daldinia decipiens]KAI1654028.1 kinase-like domain-containing protein [Daldinia decipiens]